MPAAASYRQPDVETIVTARQLDRSQAVSVGIAALVDVLRLPFVVVVEVPQSAIDWDTDHEYHTQSEHPADCTTCPQADVVAQRLDARSFDPVPTRSSQIEGVHS
jgi:hypothetical protein